MTNGTVVTFNVKNGSKGQPGAAQAAYKSVETLPTASAETMDKIYLTPSGTAGVYNMSYTDFDGASYSWVPMGTTAIQLSDYATRAEFSQLEAKVGKLGGTQTYGSESYCGFYYSGSQNKTIASGSTANGVVIPVKTGLKYEFSGTANNNNYGVTLFTNEPELGSVAVRAVKTSTGSFIPQEGENYALFTLVFATATSVQVKEGDTGLVGADTELEKQISVAMGGGNRTTYGSESYCGLYFSHSSQTVKNSGSTANGVIIPLVKGTTYNFEPLRDNVTLWKDIPFPADSSCLARELDSYATTFTAGENENYALFTLIFSRATSVTVESGSTVALKVMDIYDCLTEENNAW
jgi:hypothetical protein